MSPLRRQQLLAAARERQALIIEDDYDGEFRYGERPLESLQTLDGGERVFYVGTFSKSLFPDLRLGYVASPAWAVAALTRARRDSDSHGNVLTQETLAAFIAEGHLARHLRRMQAVYARRRAVLLQGLQQHFAGLLRPLPSQAGLHLAAQVEESTYAPAWLDRAGPAPGGIATLRRFQAEAGGARGLVLGFGAAETDAIDAALLQLRRKW